jgi:hypothetical protein
MNPTLKGIDQWPNTASLRQLCEAADKANPGTCSICGSAMVKGMALENTVAGSDDGFGATLSQTGPAEMVECMKCPTCGHSVHGLDIASFPPSSPATPSESPERVETAEEAFRAWWDNLGCDEYLRVSFKAAFRAGYEAGRRSK